MRAVRQPLVTTSYPQSVLSTLQWFWNLKRTILDWRLRHPCQKIFPTLTPQFEHRSFSATIRCIVTVSNGHIVGTNLPSVHDQFSVGCADGGTQARSSQVHASKAFRSTTEALCFKNRTILTLLWVRPTKDLFVLLRNGDIESRVLNKTDELVIAYNFRKTNAKVNIPSITISDWARLVPPKESTPDTFGQ